MAAESITSKMQYTRVSYRILLIFSLFLVGCEMETDRLVIEDLGKEYRPLKEKLLQGLYHHIEEDDNVVGGNTSIRNMDAEHLVWKGNPNGNGYGYFQRNRDLGQVFTVPATHDVQLDALVLRTSRGDNAVMYGTPGAALYVVFYEVEKAKGQEIRINGNGTTKGDEATHGFDVQFNRADDYIEGVDYVFLHRSEGGIFPEIPPTTQFVYDKGDGKPFGEQEGHLRYFRCDLLNASELILEAGKQYAFMIGFSHPGEARGLALAIDSEVHTKEAAEFVRDGAGNIRWGIRREGNGRLPPTMTVGPTPPPDKEMYDLLVSESLFPPDHYETLTPTTNGYPDVDTYRTLQFYLELKKTIPKKGIATPE
ncbi:hypothetical protein FK220_011355 [Flavobacteriaceae bacterium TP-CH-4]|uniref:Uncharacterized protein n=1 Tax=Pelagihabitans pacificus TaxID=2696054 RepID=A0A967EB12_9FLAO|nr:hypothetical protein [Pelagihabitans pacificus]NHF59941.1 hypothetical protein [Pelagihabitans pacificus]